MIGGLPASNNGSSNLDPDMHQVPFPDGFRVEDTSFDLFLKTWPRPRSRPAGLRE